jgi:peptide/nickel transport system substrate-binding protein
MRAPRQSITYATFNTADPAFADPRVRLAFRYLVDYQGLEKTVMRFDGFGRASVVPFGAAGALDREAGQPFSLDLAKAKALIDAAGQGHGFKRELVTSNQNPAGLLAQHIQANAAKIGIDIQINQMAAAQMINRLRARNFEMGLLSWNSSVADANDFVQAHVVNRDNRPDMPPGNNAAWWSGWQSADLNRMADEALFEKDADRRRALYQEIQRRVMAEGPSAFLFQLVRNAGVHNAVKDVKFTGNRFYYASAGK